MKTIEYRTMDKSGWIRGPWDNEPDKVQWQDETTGFPCLIVRNVMGALCGYVGVPEGHPWFRKHYDDCQPYPDCHGGLTYSDECQPGSETDSICHVPAPGEPDHVWWLGFDCAHSGDLTDMSQDNAWRDRFPSRGDVYRDMAYVRAECAKLAAQAAMAQTS